MARDRLLSTTLAATILLILSAAFELGLRILSPVQLVTIGSGYSQNAGFYGWGYDPGESVVLRDPDTGTLFHDKINKRGWRDTDHEFAKPDQTFRILVLGDSNTFAPLVPLEQSYPRLLEKRLLNEGYRAEVISMAYGGWGSDQELEALKREGLKYRPDLVVVQFCANDLADNLYWKHPEYKGYKPFFYQLVEGRLERRDNAEFQTRRADRFKDILKMVVLHSELLKRAYLVYRSLAASSSSGDGEGFRVSLSKLQQMQNILELQPDDPLSLFLSQRLDQPLQLSELEAVLANSILATQAQAILRIAENRASTRAWGGNPSSNRTAPDWLLLLALLDEARLTAQQAGAAFALISDNEPGLYEWERAWFRVKTDKASREAYLGPLRILREWARENQAGFIEQVRPIERARNDPHPNFAGNRAMADNIYDFLMTNHKAQLERLP